MHRKAIKFRDVWVAPGSECYEALQNGQTIKATEIVLRCEREALAQRLGVHMDVLNQMLAVRNTAYRDPRLPADMT